MSNLRQVLDTIKPLEKCSSVKRLAEIIGVPHPISLKYLLDKASMDSDLDGLPDFWEQMLAEKYAPIIYHSNDESNFPTNVDWFLQKTELRFYDDNCTPDLDELIIKNPSQEQLLTQSYKSGCGSEDTVYSNGTRSKGKQRTFYLKDIAEEFRKGSLDSQDWTTYFHTYPNDLGGVTIQYWRFYAYNDAFDNHGGDWEGIHIVLNKDLQPAKLDLLGHSDIDHLSPSDFQWEGTHVRIFSEGGGHASIAVEDKVSAIGGHIDVNNPFTFVRQETWTGGNVQWFNGVISKNGALVNIGSKIKPMNGQVFIQYSGLWGSPGAVDFNSGYWGPAFNETDMRVDGFITAWGLRMVGEKDFIQKECYPSAVSR